MTLQTTNNYSIQSYVNKNRNNIDEALVSLRLMKQIDDFLDYKDITNRELAKNLNYTESYISQLMSGVKKVNISFLNKFEQTYNVELDFKIKLIEENLKILNSMQDKVIKIINFNLNIVNINNSTSFQFKTSNKDLFEYEEAEYENVEYGN